MSKHFRRSHLVEAHWSSGRLNTANSDKCPLEQLKSPEYVFMSYVSDQDHFDANSNPEVSFHFDFTQDQNPDPAVSS